jgi:hypothetical protein
VAQRLFTVPVSGGTPTLAYSAGNDGPRPEQVSWSADGRSLFFKSHDASGIASVWMLPATGGTARLVTRFDDPARPSSRFNLAVGREHLYFAIDERQSDVWVLELAAEAAR